MGDSKALSRIKENNNFRTPQEKKIKKWSHRGKCYSSLNINVQGGLSTFTHLQLVMLQSSFLWPVS